MSPWITYTSLRLEQYLFLRCGQALYTILKGIHITKKYYEPERTSEKDLIKIN